MQNAAHNENGARKLDLSICIVTYNPDLEVLARTLESLRIALGYLESKKISVLIVDNSHEGALKTWLPEHFSDLSIELKCGHGNIGFGRANNMALATCGDFHLVLNPDVELAPDALVGAMTFMEAHKECGLLTPLAFGTDGKRQYLCKRFPSIFDLALRGFAPARIRKLFKRRLDRYEMRGMRDDEVYWNPMIVSGCFMFLRGELFREMGGFDSAYFLYFEDFDLSLRVGKKAAIAFVPAVRIVHGGGDAGRKGLWHIKQFTIAAAIFFRKFGLKLA